LLIAMPNLLVRFNNWRSRRKQGLFAPGQVLVLLPSCLQRTACDANLRTDIRNCRRCGRCNIGEVLALAEQMGVEVAVATGGREAVRRVREPGVKAVVAIACGKELLAGTLATFPKPVLSIENSRPNGPCKDTRVDIAEVRRAIESFLKKT
jgi:hypothetical protein